MNRRRFLTVTGGAVLTAGAAARLLQMGPVARAQGLAPLATYQGAAGKSIQGPVNLSAGVTVLRAQHNGNGNFSVSLAIPAAGETPQQSFDDASATDRSLVYDEVTSFKGAAVAMATIPGPHYLDVTAAGAYQISVEQPTPETVPTVQQTTFTGKGKNVTPYFTLPDGISTLSVQTSAKQFRGWLWHVDDLGGEAVQGGAGGYDGRFFDFTSASPQSSFPVVLPDSGPYLLSTDNVTPNDTWTFTFQ